VPVPEQATSDFDADTERQVSGVIAALQLIRAGWPHRAETIASAAGRGAVGRARRPAAAPAEGACR